MICKKCGTQVAEGLKFCPICGTSTAEEVVVANNTVNNIESTNVVAPTEPVNNDTLVSSPTTNYNANIGYNNMVQQPLNNTPTEPVNNYQQPYNYSNMNQPMNSNNGKKDKTIFIVIGIILVALAIGGIYMFTQKDKEKSSNSNSNSSSNVESNINSNSNSNNVSNSNSASNSNSNSNNNGGVTTNTSAVTFEGYTFQIPKTYATRTTNGQLQLVSSTKVMALDTQDGSFTQLKASKDYVKEYLENAGYTVSKLDIKTINGVEFIVGEIKTSSNQNMLMGYASLGANKVFVVVAANTSYTIDYNLLYEAADIVKSAKKVA